MTQSGAAVVAASIGGLTALIAALVAGAVALRNESHRRSAARKDVDRQTLRAQAAEVFRQMFVLQHEMEWLTWHAANRPKSLNSQMTRAYESSVHDSYPRILGAMAVLASMDIGLYRRLEPLMERLFEAESQIGGLINGLSSRRKRGSSLVQLKQLNEPVRTLYLDLPPEMAEVMQYSDLLHSDRRAPRLDDLRAENPTIYTAAQVNSWQGGPEPGVFSPR
jgi:hypothetical protein